MKYIKIDKQTERINRTLFVYKKEKKLKFVSMLEARELDKNKNYIHTSTIDPAIILERITNGKENINNIIEELKHVNPI